MSFSEGVVFALWGVSPKHPCVRHLHLWLGILLVAIGLFFFSMLKNQNLILTHERTLHAVTPTPPLLQTWCEAVQTVWGPPSVVL